MATVRTSTSYPSPPGLTPLHSLPLRTPASWLPASVDSLPPSCRRSSHCAGSPSRRSPGRSLLGRGLWGVGDRGVDIWICAARGSLVGSCFLAPGPGFSPLHSLPLRIPASWLPASVDSLPPSGRRSPHCAGSPSRGNLGRSLLGRGLQVCGVCGRALSVSRSRDERLERLGIIKKEEDLLIFFSLCLDARGAHLLGALR